MGDDTACALGSGRAFAPAADAGGGGAHRRLDGAGRADLIYRAGRAAYRPPPERHRPLGTDPGGPVRRFAAGLADYGAQRLFMPWQLPVGVLTVSLGGIYLIALLIQESRKK